MGVELDRVPVRLLFQTLLVPAGGFVDSDWWHHPGGRCSIGLFSTAAPGWVEIIDMALVINIAVVGSVGGGGAWTWDPILPPGLMSCRVHNTGGVASYYVVSVVA
jgi:hypothetical protein